MSAMYFAVGGNAFAGAGALVVIVSDEVASVEVPPEQAERVPRAIIALTHRSRVRVCLFM
jgi:hypothetical protein